MSSARAANALNHRAPFPVPNRCIKCNFTFRDIIFCLLKWLITMPSTEGPVMNSPVPCPSLPVSMTDTQRQRLWALLMFSSGYASLPLQMTWICHHFLLVPCWPFNHYTSCLHAETSVATFSVSTALYQCNVVSSASCCRVLHMEDIDTPTSSHPFIPSRSTWVPLLWILQCQPSHDVLWGLGLSTFVCLHLGG